MFQGLCFGFLGFEEIIPKGFFYAPSDDACILFFINRDDFAINEALLILAKYHWPAKYASQQKYDRQKIKGGLHI